MHGKKNGGNSYALEWQGGGVRVTPSSISKGTYKAPSPKTKCGSVKNDA